MFARQLPAVATTSSSLQIQYVQLAPWSCQIPARCFRVSHIIYMLTLCICFQTFFFLAYHVGNTGDAARRTLRFDEELHAPPAPNASVDGELVTYAPVRNITRWRRVWRHEARKFLREYEAACADGWPSPNGTNVTNTTSFPSPAGDMTVNVVELKSSKTVDRIAPLPLCACVPSGLSK